MYRTILKATRAHCAALKHRPAPDRIPLDYTVWYEGSGKSGTVHVKASTAARRRAEASRLFNRLRAMYPEIGPDNIVVTYRAPCGSDRMITV